MDDAHHAPPEHAGPDLPDTTLTVLPHTGLAVPDATLRVTAIKQMRHSHGVAWEATLHRAADHVGWFANTGHGEESTFNPSNWDTFSLRDFERFARACTRDGEPLAYDELAIDALVTEYDMQVDIDAARAKGRAVLRLADPAGTYPDLTVAHPFRLRDLPAQQRLLNELRMRQARRNGVLDWLDQTSWTPQQRQAVLREGVWEWWDGTAWTPLAGLTSPPEAAEQT